MAADFQKELLSSLVSNIKNYSGSDPLRPWLQYGIRKEGKKWSVYSVFKIYFIHFLLFLYSTFDRFAPMSDAVAFGG